eukprot:4695654-Pyramimonas_sp.AAC.1
MVQSRPWVRAALKRGSLHNPSAFDLPPDAASAKVGSEVAHPNFAALKNCVAWPVPTDSSRSRPDT